MLKVENLSFSVNEKGAELNILSDISFDVKKGEMLVITGPNGGGKSTLAKVLMGIEKAESGKVILDGEDITDYDIDERAKAGIGFAFQQPPRFKGMTVDKLISLAAGEHKSEAECCDLLSRVGLCALNTAKKHFFELVEKYGEDTVRACMEEALDYTERRTRAAIKKLPNGVYTADDYIDADGVNNKAIFVKATVTIEDEDITVDLTGSSPTVDGPVNFPLAGTCSGVYFGLKFFLDPDAPPNAGMYRPIHIIVPENTVFNPRWPAPVYYGNLITSEKVADLIWQCLEQAIPEQIVGMPYADCNPISWGVVNAREGVSDTFGELPPGGWGGTPFGDGMSATYSRHGNCMDFTPEQMELLYPVICTEREFKEDSAGAGKYRGGLALQVSWKLLQNSTMNVGMGRSRFGPPGGCGGKDGKPSSVILNMGTDREEVIGGYTKDHEYLMTMFDNYPMKAGDTVTMITQGGGGYGDPKERDPELVKKDVRNGLVSKEAALEEYGVKL